MQWVGSDIVTQEAGGLKRSPVSHQSDFPMNTPTLCETILGKPLDKIQFEEVEKFFSTPRIETDTVEFKAFDSRGEKQQDAHEQRIYETLCAMLNSQGGLIVWGAPIGIAVQGQKEKVVQGKLTHVPNQLEPDQLTNKVTSRITPLPPVVRHRSISKGEVRIYIFEAPKSPFGPHQVGGTYFFRLYGRTEKAPHHIVQAMMRQLTYPDVRCYLRVSKVEQLSDTKTIHFSVACANHSKLQNERDVVLQVHVLGGRFDHNHFETRKVYYGHGMQQITLTKVTEQLHYGTMHTERFKVTVPPGEHMDGDHVYFQIAVGGRYAPLRFSHYTVQAKADQSDYRPLTSKTIDNRLMADSDNPEGFEEELKRFEVG